MHFKSPLLSWFFLISVKRRLSITMSKQGRQIYLKWKLDQIIYFQAKKAQNETGLRVSSIYGSILSLIDVRSPSKVSWTPVTVLSASHHINLSCIVISFYTFVFIRVISVNLV